MSANSSSDITFKSVPGAQGHPAKTKAIGARDVIAFIAIPRSLRRVKTLVSVYQRVERVVKGENPDEI